MPFVVIQMCRDDDRKVKTQDSDAETWRNLEMRAGSMDLVRQTLQGMAARSSDEGVKAMGPHARTIRLGRALWQSPPLEAEVATTIQERFRRWHVPSACRDAQSRRESKATRRAAA